ncbi:ferredoxin [Mycolicibacterium vaccae]|uniref:Ferredoxin n=1 Tax=Mycolicibacterium vaccae ATCC 25954 TaxID=1194972 RepID=K0V600_MYCVA|nr:ferredoxin [Mycolicibacterium vaccae]EJZ12970.1 ferredoxin [Mycolicibacterium vaccae ATCC 25954]MCV7063933.1 ferredoxin [Mycolicibacterium vaccae]
MKVHVDSARCQGHTLCAMIAPDMFTLSEVDGSASAVTTLAPADREKFVIEAAQSCPEQAIVLDHIADEATSQLGGQRAIQ